MPTLPTKTGHNFAKNEQKEADILELQTMLKTIFNLLTKLDHITEDILIMLNKGIAKTKNNEKSMRIVTEIRMHLVGIIQDQTNLLISTKP
jgi:hypothetical protein